MSRLADILSTSLPSSTIAESAGLLAKAGSTPFTLPGLDFQELFQQELLQQQAPATRWLPLDSTLPATSVTETHEESETVGAPIEVLAKLPGIVWLPLAIAAPQTSAPAAATVSAEVHEIDAALGSGSTVPTASMGKLDLGETRAQAATSAANKGNATLPTLSVAEMTARLPGGDSPSVQAPAMSIEMPASGARVSELAGAPNSGQTPQATASLEGEARAQALGTVSSSNAIEKPATLVASMTAHSSIHTPSSSAMGTVSVPVGASGWGEDFAQQIVVLAKPELNTVQLRLTPAELGPIEISMTLRKDQAEATFVAASAPVREAIEAALPRLREIFAENGITLGHTAVSQEFSQSRQTFAEQTPSNQAGEKALTNGPDRGAASEVLPQGRRSRGLVDIFA